MNEMDKGFDQVVNIIHQARENAFRKFSIYKGFQMMK